MELSALSVKEDDLSSSHSHHSSSSSFCEQEDFDKEEMQQEDEDEAEDEREASATSKVKVNNNPKRKFLARFFSFVVFFVSAALLLDYFLYSRMKLEIKTVDAVLGYENPDASIHLGIEVSSRMLFSSIKVNTFECDAAHKAPDDKKAQYFASITSQKSFVTPAMLQQKSDLSEEHFIQDMDISVSDIDFGILKRAVQDSVLTTNGTASRMDCVLDVDVFLFGLVPISLSWERAYGHKCDDCVTKKDFGHADLFMAAMVGSLLVQENTPASVLRPDEENHKHSITFSETAEEFVFTLDKHVDLSEYLSGLERFTIDVPSSEYVISSKDNTEFWTTSTSPFSVDLAAEGGTTLRSDITTTCTDSSTNQPCQLVTPLKNFVHDVWEGHMNYEISSASAAALMKKKEARLAAAEAAHSSLNHDDDGDNDDYFYYNYDDDYFYYNYDDDGDNDGNFIESLFGVEVSFELTLDYGDFIEGVRDIGDIPDDISDIRDGMGDIRDGISNIRDKFDNAIDKLPDIDSLSSDISDQVNNLLDIPGKIRDNLHDSDDVSINEGSLSRKLDHDKVGDILDQLSDAVDTRSGGNLPNDLRDIVDGIRGGMHDDMTHHDIHDIPSDVRDNFRDGLDENMAINQGSISRKLDHSFIPSAVPTPTPLPCVNVEVTLTDSYGYGAFYHHYLYFSDPSDKFTTALKMAIDSSTTRTICLPYGSYAPFACGSYSYAPLVSWSIAAYGVSGGSGSSCSPSSGSFEVVQPPPTPAPLPCVDVVVTLTDKRGYGVYDHYLYFSDPSDIATTSLKIAYYDGSTTTRAQTHTICLIPERTYSPFACGLYTGEGLSWSIEGYDINGVSGTVCSPSSGSFYHLTTGPPPPPPCVDVAVTLVDWYGYGTYYDFSLYFSDPSDMATTSLKIAYDGSTTRQTLICLPPGSYSPFACGPWPTYGYVTWSIDDYGISGGAGDVCFPNSGSFDVVDFLHAGSVVLKVGGRKVDLFKLSMTVTEGWPGHNGGMMSTVDMNLFDGTLLLRADLNAGPDDMEVIVREFDVPAIGLLNELGVISSDDRLEVSWHKDGDAEEVILDYQTVLDGSEGSGSFTIPYGIYVDLLNDVGGDNLDGFHLEEEEGADDDSWHCQKLSHDDKDRSVVFCYNTPDTQVKVTAYDSNMNRIVEFTGEAAGTLPKIDYSDDANHFTEYEGQSAGTLDAVEDIRDEFSSELDYIYGDYIDHALQFISNVLTGADGSVTGDFMVYDQDSFPLSEVQHLRFGGSLELHHHIDMFLEYNDDEKLFVSGTSGTEDFNSLLDMGITTTEFFVRVDGDEQLRVEMDGANVRLLAWDDMSAELDDFKVVLGDDVVVDVTVRMSAAIESEYADLSVELTGKDDKELLFVSGVTGWEDFNSLFDLGITTTEFFVRVDGDEQLRVEMDGVFARLLAWDDMSVGLESFSLAIANEQLVDTTLLGKYIDHEATMLIDLALKEEEALFADLQALLKGDSHEDWTVDLKKALLRLDGEELVDMTMKMQMQDIEDSVNDVHLAMDVHMLLVVDGEEYLNLQGMHTDMIAETDDDCWLFCDRWFPINSFQEMSIATDMHGILNTDESFNGTLSIDKESSQWTIATNGFKLQSIVASPSNTPTIAPTSVPTLSPTSVPSSVPTHVPTFAPSFQSTVEVSFAQVFDGVSESDFTENPAAIDVLVKTIAKTLNVSSDDVEFLGVEDVPTTGNSISSSSSSSGGSSTSSSSGGDGVVGVKDSTGSVRVLYAVKTALQNIGAGFQDANEAANFLATALDDSISNGNFVNDFQALAVEEEVTVLEGVTATVVTVEEITVTYNSPVPTSVPSVQPTLAPTAVTGSKSSGDEDTFIGTSMVVTIVILAAIVVFFCVVFALVVVYLSKKKSSAEVEVNAAELENGLQKREDYSSVVKNNDPDYNDDHLQQQQPGAGPGNTQLVTTGGGEEYAAVTLGEDYEHDHGAPDYPVQHHQPHQTVTLGYDEEEDCALTKAHDYDDTARI